MSKMFISWNGFWVVPDEAIDRKTAVYLPGIGVLCRFSRISSQPGPSELNQEILSARLQLVSALDPSKLTRWSENPRIWWQGCFEVPIAARDSKLDLLLPDGTILRPDWAGSQANLSLVARVEEFVIAEVHQLDS